MPITILAGDMKYRDSQGNYQSLEAIRGEKGDPGQKGDTGDPAPASAVVPAVEDWLEENITNPDSPPLDRSLSSSSAAAPADLVGELKNQTKNSAVTNLTQNAVVRTNGLYIGTDGVLTTGATTNRTIVVNALPNKPYKIKKSTSTIMRVGCGASDDLTAGSLYSFSGHSSASSDALYVNTDTANHYVYIQLFANSDNSSLQSVSANTATLVIVENITKEIEDQNKAVNTLIPIDLAKETTYTTGKYVDYSTGDLNNSTTGKATDYIDLTGIEKIIYSRIYTTATSSYLGIAFYDSGKTFIQGSGQRAALNQGTYHYELTRLDVPTGAKYVRLSGNTTIGNPVIYDADDYNNKVYPRIEALETEVSEYSSQIANIDNHIEHVNDNGYFVLPLDNWEVGSWQSYSSPTSSVTNRCRYKSQIKFDRDIYILADVGFMVGGYYSDGTAISNSSIVKIPKNQTFKIYVRRFSEVSETADVSTFANAVKFSTALAPIELYSPTFTDISMFERVGICGDSYASGGGWISGKTGLTWGKNLERQAGISVDIYARSGENIIGWNSDDTKGLPALLAGDECGLYWMQHGINGTSTVEITGTPDDMSANPHPNTFYGQYVEAIEQIQTTFPNAKIVLATICGSDWELAQNAQYSRANTAIKNIAEYCHVPCVDITKDDFFRSLFYKNGMQSNHPSAMVSAGMAMAHRRLLSKCIQENASYFLNYHEDPH